MSKGKIRRWQREYGDDSDAAARARMERHLAQIESLSDEAIAKLYHQEFAACEKGPEWAYLHSLSDEAIADEFKRSLSP